MKKKMMAKQSKSKKKMKGKVNRADGAEEVSEVRLWCALLVMCQENQRDFCAHWCCAEAPMRLLVRGDLESIEANATSGAHRANSGADLTRSDLLRIGLCCRTSQRDLHGANGDFEAGERCGQTNRVEQSKVEHRRTGQNRLDRLPPVVRQHSQARLLQWRCAQGDFWCTLTFGQNTLARLLVHGDLESIEANATSGAHRATSGAGNFEAGERCGEDNPG
jgi:hypothetical protein